MTPTPGEIWYGFAGATERKRVIIVSREELNRGGYVGMVPITLKKYGLRKNLRNCVPLAAGRFGLTENSVAQAENLTLVEYSDLDCEAGPIARVDVVTMRAVVKAIGYVIGSDCDLL